MILLLRKSEVIEAPYPLVSYQAAQFPIHFEDVSFKYKDRNILENISFKIEAGETASDYGAHRNWKINHCKSYF
jgi:ABC-type multidrug transport system fused ATPase/permease subunit